MSFPISVRNWGDISSLTELDEQFFQSIVDEIEAIERYLLGRLEPMQDPEPPGSPSYNWEGKHLSLAWTSPGGEMTPAYVMGYSVQIYSASGGTLYADRTVDGTSYVWTYEQQLADTGGSPDPSVYVELRTLSFSGKRSIAAALYPVNAAPDPPTSATYNFDGPSLIIEYEWPDESDILEATAELITGEF